VEKEKPASSSPAGVEADVVSALVNLGYDARVAEKTVDEARKECGSANFEKLLRAALQALSQSKSRAARTS
jgi:Holliday junction resolvasome RuvABC DNA-binding subunit